MFKKKVLIGLVILIISNFTGIAYGKGDTTGYLQVIYKSCECGMTKPHVYSCYAPFHIVGNKIIGDFEEEEDSKIHLPLRPIGPYDPDPSDFEKQIIMYSYKCPTGDDDCPTMDVSGQLVVHRVNGRVMKVKGKKMLAFEVRLSIPECTMKVCNYVQDCSMEPWFDEFLVPFQDGYRTERGKNVLFVYVVNLQVSHKDTTSLASERAAISSVRNRIKSLRSRVTRIKGLVRVYRNSETKISRLQKQQRSLKIKKGLQELKRASNISIQSDRWAANSQHTIHSVLRESQTLLTETQQLMTEVQRLQSILKAASVEDLERLAAEAAGLAHLTGAVQDVLDVEYKGNCYDLPNFDACIECCKSRNKITADPGTQMRESQEAFRSFCTRTCDIITTCEDAEDAMEEQKDILKDILKMLQDLAKQKQEQQSASVRKF